MHRPLVHMHGRCNFNLKCYASPPWRFGFCWLSIFYSKRSVLPLFQLMDRHISILKTVCRPCGKRLPSKSGYSGVWTASVEMVASYRLFKSSVTTFSLTRARRYLLPWKWKIEVRQIFCVQKETDIAVIFGKFVSDPSKQKSCASWFSSYARPL